MVLVLGILSIVISYFVFPVKNLGFLVPGFYSSGVILWVFIAWIAFIDPGYTSQAMSTTSETQQGHIKPLYCNKCGITSELASSQKISHCKICKICVSYADHHCFILGNCIGRNNICCFYFLVPLMIVFLCFGGVCLHNSGLQKWI